MQRIATPTREQDLFGPGKDGFRDGNQGTSTSSTQLESLWFNSLQEEICNVIELAGLTLDAADMTQLWQAMGASGGAYLPLTGGTLTGGLVGTSGQFNQLIVAPTSNDAAVHLDSVSGTIRVVRGRTAGVPRWDMNVGDNNPETGSGNAGSDFVIARYSDAGTMIDQPLMISRASGQMTFSCSVNPLQLLFNVPAAGMTRNLTGQTGVFNRWTIQLGNSNPESANNLGSDFAIMRFSDGGTFIDPPLMINRATGQSTFSVAIVNGPSDRALKENIVPLEASLDKVLKLQGVSFDLIDDPVHRKQIGLIAQDVLPVVPEIIQRYQPDMEKEAKLALDYPKLTALLIEALKELNTRVVALEGSPVGKPAAPRRAN